MRQVIIDEYLDEWDVHPKNTFERLNELSMEAFERLLGQQTPLNDVPCPGCESSRQSHAFERHGFQYRFCGECSTLFVSPRPTAKQLEWYLKSSKMADFRRSEEYTKSMDDRFLNLAFHRTDWMERLVRRHSLPENGMIGLIEPRTGHLPNKLIERGVGTVQVVSPLFPVEKEVIKNEAVLSVDSIDAMESESASLIAAFEVVEHVVSPADFFASVFDALEPGGIFLITTRAGSGFDIQVLWEHSSILPLEHLNLFSVEGLRKLFESAGFEITELSTPGQLDLQIIQRVCKEKEDVSIPRFLTYFFENRDRHAFQRFQNFLQENLLSSFMRVVARKPVS